jgi:hypothetical protein
MIPRLSVLYTYFFTIYSSPYHGRKLKIMDTRVIYAFFYGCEKHVTILDPEVVTLFRRIEEATELYLQW